MRVVVQRVLSASVEVEGNIVSSIDEGLLVLLGIHKTDTEKEMEFLIRKILGMRIFNDENNQMNLSVRDISGDILIISQFTLYGDLKKGKKPSYSDALKSNEAEILYNIFLNKITSQYSKIKSGIFGADMKVSLINSGPVTILLDS